MTWLLLLNRALFQWLGLRIVRCGNARPDGYFYQDGWGIWIGVLPIIDKAARHSGKNWIVRLT